MSLYALIILQDLISEYATLVTTLATRSPEFPLVKIAVVSLNLQHLNKNSMQKKGLLTNPDVA